MWGILVLTQASEYSEVPGASPRALPRHHPSTRCKGPSVADLFVDFRFPLGRLVADPLFCVSGSL